MNQLKISGLLLIIGFVLYVSAMLIAPRLYQEADIAKRVAIIETQRNSWIISQFLFALGASLPALGFLLLTYHLRQSTSLWLHYFGAAAFTSGTIAGLVFFYRQTLDPGFYWNYEGLPPLISIYMLFVLAGLFILAVPLRESGLPAWLGYGLQATSVFLLFAFMALRAGGAFFISIGIYLLSFVAGIILWRQ